MRRRLSPYFVILTGFLALILAGSFLLVLPISTRGGISYVDALFLSASSVCITGLSTVNVASTFTGFGQAVICLLVQVGGLGFVTIGMTILSMLGMRTGLSGRRLVEETLGSSARLDYRRFLRCAVLITLVLEGFGFAVDLIALRNIYSGGKLVWISLFHAVSAFNNAGLDLFGNGMIPFSGNVLLILNTSFLTIVGGLGFVVLIDLLFCLRGKKTGVHTRIVLIVTAVLLSAGTLLLWWSEHGKMDLLNAFFMSAMARTCGFATQDIGQWNNASLCVLNLLMFIGAGPVSTGGGIKCTTFFVFFAGILGLLKGKPTIVFHRKISRETLIYAMFVTVVGVIYAFVTGTLLCAFEPEIPLSSILTETVSALANVGLSTGITPILCTGSKIILSIAMFLGRIGFMTALLVFKRRWNRAEDDSIRYVYAEIIIG